LNDTPDRIQAKLIKAFAEITGIRAEPAHAQVHRWLYAKTEAPLGESFCGTASPASACVVTGA